MKKTFLILGILLSISSKIIQIRFKSIWGDVLILPAATMFVLAILFYWPRYVSYLRQEKSKNKAIAFAVFCCLAVLSFQIFTILSFGKGMNIGYLFIVPFVCFTVLGLYFWIRLSKEK